MSFETGIRSEKEMTRQVMNAKERENLLREDNRRLRAKVEDLEAELVEWRAAFMVLKVEEKA